METIVSTHETAIRLGVFASVFVVMAMAEALFPRRGRTLSRWTRWPSNLGIVALNTLVGRLLLPLPPIAVAALAGDHGWGLFNQVDLPGWLAIAACVLAMDFAIWLQHVMFHAVPAFWRLHRMHHADLDYDVTTGARFHPVEIVLSLGLKLSWIVLLGAPAAAVLIFEVLLNATAMFNHANVRLPEGLDRVLRLVMVTPDMHRVHHSVHPHETNSNFGFNLPWWDRLFGTYQAQPRDGHVAMTIGIDLFRDPGEARLDRMLLQPLRPGEDHYAVNRRDWGAP